MGSGCLPGLAPRIMLVSDVHYEHMVFHGVDESGAWEWLLDMVLHQRPDLLLSAGDLGTAVTPGDIGELARHTVFHTIYGNHDNLQVLKRARNRDGSRVLLRDCAPVERYGIVIAGINGIVSKTGRAKRGVPRKTPGQYLMAAQCLRDRRVDLLLMHETPYLPGLFPMRRTLGAETALKALELARPRAVGNGHFHVGGYRVARLPVGALYLYVDSSQQSRHYLILEPAGDVVRVEAWRGLEKVWEGVERF